MKKVYFPNLNGLRFIAALMVLIHHIEQFKNVFGIKNYLLIPFVAVIGKLGVVLFFVLSGFLITFLLLEEEKQTTTISIKDFYMRRVLRIWPLYFLIVGMGFFILSKIPFFQIGELSGLVSANFVTKLILFVLFLPNLSLVLFPPIPYASLLWSVGVEEQFYAIWPVLMKKIKRKEFLFCSIIIGYSFMSLFGFTFIKEHFGFQNIIDVLISFWSVFNIDCMAIGALFAILLFKRKEILNVFFNRYTQIIVLSTTCLLVFFGIHIPYFHYQTYALLFGILILNLAANKNSILNLENQLFNYFGKISFGIYVFHPVAIVIALKSLDYIKFNNVISQYILSFLLVILFASISYKYFEKYFIAKKIFFSKIVSGIQSPDKV